MYIIWLNRVVRCSLNNVSWKVEVKPSKITNMAKRIRPDVLCPSVASTPMGPVRRKTKTPVVKQQAKNQSEAPYVASPMAVDHAMTGSSLKLLPRVWTGKLTCFKALYWHTLLKTLDTDTVLYLPSGACGAKVPLNAKLTTTRQTSATMRLQKTRPTASSYMTGGSPYGNAIIRSCR